VYPEPWTRPGHGWDAVGDCHCYDVLINVIGDGHVHTVLDLPGGRAG